MRCLKAISFFGATLIVTRLPIKVNPVFGDNYFSPSHCLNETDTERYWLLQLKDSQIVSAAVEMLAKAQLVDSIRSRYNAARKRDKSRILDEFVAITGH
jgi:hypothetical protein